MTRHTWLRRDFFVTSDPRLANWCGWLVVAVAASVPLGSAASNVLGGALFVMLLAAGGYQEHWQRWRANPFAIATLLLFAVIFLGISYSHAPFDEIRRSLTKYSRLLYAPIAISVLLDGRWRRRALLAWMGSMLLTLALSYLHSVWQFPLARATREGEVGDHFIFKHHITQNVMMSVFVVAAFAEAWRLRLAEGMTRRAWLWVVITIAAVINVLFYVLGRAGYLTLVVNLVVVAAVAFVAARDTRLLAFVGAIIVVVIAAAASSDAVRQRFHTAISEVESSQERGITTSIGQRMEYASKSIELIEARPILGWGTGSYAMEYCRIARSPEWCKLGAYNPHNQFLFFAVQFGALGLLALIGWLVTAAYVIHRLPPGEQMMGFALLATLIVHSLLDSPLYIVTEGTWYPLMLGIFAAGAYPGRSESAAMAAAATASTDGQSG
jgi:O-antigen ligase